MENDFLYNTFNAAVQAFSATQKGDMRHLSAYENAFMLSALPPLHELLHVREQVAQHLHPQLSVAFIKNGALHSVFAVLAALWEHNPSFISGKHLACAVQRLIASETATGGPYRSGSLVSVPANAQIAIFMRLVAQPLPKVDTFLTGIIAKKHFEGTGHTRFGILYLLAKAHPCHELTHYVAQQWRQTNWQTPARIAIALSILQDEVRPAHVQQALTALHASQRASGFWDGETLFTTQHQTSSHLMTTALIIGVLARFRRHPTNMRLLDLQNRQRIVALTAKRLFEHLSEPLRSVTLEAIDHMCSADKNFEITLLPYFFTLSLKSPAAHVHQYDTTLGAASLCGWIAYTIYDDFLDNEGTPVRLPAANIAMRASLDYFKKVIPRHAHFQYYIAKTYTTMDEANAWEVSHCRFIVHAKKIHITKLPAYGNGGMLAARSSAHALTPMAILVLSKQNSKISLRLVASAFRHYLIAKQLNDDMYDWQKDMQAGHASYVVTLILRDMRIKPGTYNLPVLLPAMQQRFRHNTMLKVCQRIIKHINLSKRAFVQSELLLKTNDIYALLDVLELSIWHSLDDHAKMQSFHENTSAFMTE